MPRIERFEDLKCWQTGRQLKRVAYQLSRKPAFSYDRDLVSQIRRAVQSVTANIAEGFEREGNREFLQFLSQAKGFAGETKDHLYTALDENHIDQAEFDNAYKLAEDTTRLTGGFMSYLGTASPGGSKFKRLGHSNPKP